MAGQNRLNDAFWRKCYVKNPSFVFRKIADETILVPVVSSTEEMDSCYPLNEMAGYIWEQIDGTRNLKDIRDKIIAEFDAEPKEAEGDLAEFIEQLLEIKAVEVTK